MAEHVHLFLKADGKDVKGEATQTSMNRAGSIECVHYAQDAETPFEPSTGQASGRRQYHPVKIRKRIDASSPLLWFALTKSQKVDGIFKFYRPNPSGDGTTEQFYTVEFTDGYVSSMHQVVEDTIAPGKSNEPPMEEVSFIFHEIRWTYTKNGAEHHDSWAES